MTVYARFVCLIPVGKIAEKSSLWECIFDNMATVFLVPN